MATINLHEPQFDASDEAMVIETLRSSWVSTGGPFVDRFEVEFAEFVNAKHAISVCNGTIALSLSLEVLKRQNNVATFDVIIPTLTFVATANAVLNAGGSLSLVDCKVDSLNIDPKLVREKIDSDYFYEEGSGKLLNRRSKNPLLAVMPVHVMGYTCDMSELKAICAEHGIAIIEDAAEALGSYGLEGQHVGNSGLASCFSFNGNKILTTGGGGMIVTNDDNFATRAKHLSTTAKTDGLRFIHDEPGYNYRLVNILAALGCSQLAKMKGRLERKNEVFELYQKNLELMGIEVVTERYNQPNHWLVNARFETMNDRERVLSYLNEQGVMSRPLWTPIHRLPFGKMLPSIRQGFPNAEAMWQTVLSLPTSPQLEDATINHICKLTAKALA